MKPPLNRTESVEVGNEDTVVSPIEPKPATGNNIYSIAIEHNTHDATVSTTISQQETSDGSVSTTIAYDSAVSPVDIKIPISGDTLDIGYSSGSPLSDFQYNNTLSSSGYSSDSLNLKDSQFNTQKANGDTQIILSRDTSHKLTSEVNLKSQASYQQKTQQIQQEVVNVTADHKPIKPGRQILRWNLLFNVLVWLVISLPIWVPFVSTDVAVILLPAVQSIFVLMWIAICILASRNLFKIYRFKNREIYQNFEETPIHHLFVISCYKEPVELISRSVQSIANQKHVSTITMSISFEEKTPELQFKITQLKDKFEHAGFARLLFTVHPFGLENEIPGKCSNSNHGFRESVEILRRELGPSFDPEHIVVTSCDADSHFPPNYTIALTEKFVDTKDKHETIYQAPLFYNWGLDGASFLTRVTGLIRSTLMMGALIPCNINSMSIFSFSLRLCIDGNFVHPAYQMDDIICLIRWMGVTRRRITICPIPVPVLSGPTSGSTVELDIMEWARQARRWTIGAGEVFHYFMVKARRMPTCAALSWGLTFIIYYGIMLCSGSLYSLSMTLSMTFLLNNSIPLYVQYWMYGLAGIQQLCFLTVFIIDVFATKALDVKEHICLARNILHWILAPVVLLAYSLVELYALHELAIKGKRVCKHGASKKDALKA